MMLHGPTPSRRPGVLLLAVLIVTAILILVGYQFYGLMSAEHEAAYVSNRVGQVRHLADSGLHQVAFMLAYPALSGLSDADDGAWVSMAAAYDDSSLFHAIPVSSSNPRLQGYYSVFAHRDYDDPLFVSQGWRNGVEDESGKINLNALLRLDRTGQRAREILLKLPNMTEETADALLNWIRPASQQTDTSIGDQVYYSSLGYGLKSGPFESQEEIMLIRGITPRWFLGNDLNRNGILDAEEDDGSSFLDPGLQRYLTVYSRERNLDFTGQPRSYLNDSDLQGLYDTLNAAVGEEVANFVLAYRMLQDQGQTTQTTVAAITSSGDSLFIQTTVQQNTQQATDATLTKDDLDLTGQARGRTINALSDLIDASITTTRRGANGRNETIRYRSPLRRDDPAGLREKMAILYDKTTTVQEMELPPRININTAPREVLLTLPGLDEVLVQEIIDNRPSPETDPSMLTGYRSPAWLITEAGVSIEALRQLEPFITTRSQVFRVQVIGYYDAFGPRARIEAVIDTNNGRPRFLYWRDITELGRGYDLTTDTALVP